MESLNKLQHKCMMGIIIFIMAVMMIIFSDNARATVMGYSLDNLCTNYISPGNHTFRSGRCSIPILSTVYPPVSGYYSVGWVMIDSSGRNRGSGFAGSIYLDASKSLDSQDMNPGTGHDTVYTFTEAGTLCDVIKAPDGSVYALSPNYSLCSYAGKTLPPTPQVNTSCTINNGNALSVSLGSLDRATLPTTPSSGAAKHIKIPVSCTGGDVTVSMNITYTAITIGSTQAVKTSANGVGTAIIYNNAAVTPTSKATINLKSGSNTVDLGFQAIRDSAVAVKDIPTGAFTASAVMVMTQQ